MKEFIFTYWKELVSLLLAFLTLLICLFKRKGKVDPVVETIYNCIPSFILDAEKKVGSGKGALKKSLVMGLVSKYYKKLSGLDLPVKSSLYADFQHFVEEVLECPQKKEI